MSATRRASDGAAIGCAVSGVAVPGYDYAFSAGYVDTTARYTYVPSPQTGDAVVSGFVSARRPFLQNVFFQSRYPGLPTPQRQVNIGCLHCVGASFPGDAGYFRKYDVADD